MQLPTFTEVGVVVDIIIVILDVFDYTYTLKNDLIR